MKKRFFYCFSIIVLLAFPLTSCNTDAQPKFDYSPSNPTAGETITFTNLTINGDTYDWDFGDGNTSTDKNPIHTYDSVVIYKVTLVATPKNRNPASILARNITVN